MKRKLYIAFAILIGYYLFLAVTCNNVRKEYYDSGEIKSITTYRCNTKNGKFVSFHRNVHLDE